MFDINAINARLGPLASAANEYAGPDAPADQRYALHCLTDVVLAHLESVLKELADETDAELKDGNLQNRTPDDRTDAWTLDIMRVLGNGTPAVQRFCKELNSIRRTLRHDPDAVRIIERAERCEAYALRCFAAVQGFIASHPWASDTPLTTAELQRVLQQDDRHRAETSSPLALLVGGAAAAAGIALSGVPAAIIAGFIGFVVTAVVVERSLRRTYG